MPWDGVERRRSENRDHDALIEVITILKAHVENFDKHILDDKDQFKVLNRNMYIAIGVVGALQFISHFIK